MLLVAIYLATMAWYHLAHTFLVRWQWLIWGEILMLGKELVRFAIIAILVSREWKTLWQHKQKRLPLITVVALLCAWSLCVSYQQAIPLRQQMIGFKYDLLPLLVLVSAILIGITTASQDQHKRQHSFLLCIAWILIFWLLRQWGKLFFSDFYARRGYGPVGDFVQGMAPPEYYRTWPWGSMRRQWLFAWPNNYGFRLVGIASFCMVSLWLLRQKKLLAWWWGIFFLSLLLTLSRGAWIGVFLQMAFLAYVQWPLQMRRRVLRWFAILILWLLAVSFFKQWSSLAHLQAFTWALGSIAQNPRWYGLGMSWPAVHFGGAYLPENHYFQLILDIGLPGVTLWFVSIYLLLRPGLQALKQAMQARVCINSLVALLTLGMLGLLVEGLFLHVFEDSMVTYLFLVPLGIALGREMMKKNHAV